MCNLFLCFVQFMTHLIQEVSHVVLPVEHGPGLLIALDVIFDFLLQILVGLFILQNTNETLVDFCIEDFILIGKF